MKTEKQIRMLYTKMVEIDDTPRPQSDERAEFEREVELLEEILEVPRELRMPKYMIPKRSFFWFQEVSNTHIPKKRKLLNNEALGAKNRVIRKGKPDNSKHSSLNNLLFNLASGLKIRDLVRSEKQILEDAYGKDWRKMLRNFMKIPTARVIRACLNRAGEKRRIKVLRG